MHDRRTWLLSTAGEVIEPAAGRTVICMRRTNRVAPRRIPGAPAEGAFFVPDGEVQKPEIFAEKLKKNTKMTGVHVAGYELFNGMLFFICSSSVGGGGQ